MSVHRQLGKVLVTQHEIERRVIELGQAITSHYRDTPLVAVGVLKGAVLFLADLVRQIDSPLCYDLVRVATYGASTAPERRPELLADTALDLADRHVLLVEDIIDTGQTLAHLRRHVLDRKPATLRSCVLLDKSERRQVEVPLDWVGFTIPNRFVVGYGLDHAERFRNLPYLAFLREEWRGPR